MCAIKGTLDKVKRRVKRRLFPLSLAFFFFFNKLPDLSSLVLSLS